MGGARRLAAVATVVVFAVATALVSSTAVVRADPAPTLTVTPSTGLVDQQVVMISGTGYAPGDAIFLAQCEAAAERCDSGTLQVANADVTGAISATFTLRRALRTKGIVPFDCVATPSACRILAGHLVGNTGAALASQTLDFASIPPPALPTLTASPTSSLADGQFVRVRASGFTAGAQVRVLECRVGPASPLPCSVSVSMNADGAGAVDLVILARRLLGLAFPSASFGGSTLDPPFDCSSPGTDCALFVTAVADPVRTNWVPLSFDPNAPPPSSGLTAFPLVGLSDGQEVTLTGQRVPHEQLVVAACRVGADPRVPGTGPCVFVTGRSADSTGNLHVEFALRRIMTGFDGQVLDCSPPAQCELLVYSVSVPLLLLEVLHYSFLEVGTSIPRFTG